MGFVCATGGVGYDDFMVLDGFSRRYRIGLLHDTIAGLQRRHYQRQLSGALLNGLDTNG